MTNLPLQIKKHKHLVLHSLFFSCPLIPLSLSLKLHSRESSQSPCLLKVPGTIVHLIDKEQSVELACKELTIVRLLQGGNVVAVLARIDYEIQWPLVKDETTVKLDESHYFFTLRVPLAPLIISIIASHHCDPFMLISNQI
ncbi:hypothetical protein ACSBR1_033353 [Camellia fascicularis]